MALHKAGRLDEFDLYVAVEIDPNSRLMSKAVFAHLGIDIPVYREVTDVYDLTENILKKFGNIVLFSAGPLCEDFSRKKLEPDWNGVKPVGDPREGLN